MKGLYSLIAVMALSIAFCSCGKEATVSPAPETTDSDELKFDITVADLDTGVDTKAAKKGWQDGDVLSIWFDGWPTFNKNANYVGIVSPFQLEYKGGKWIPYGPSAEVKKNLKSKGRLTVVYDGLRGIKCSAAIETTSVCSISYKANSTNAVKVNGVSIKPSIRPMLAYIGRDSSNENYMYEYNASENTLSAVLTGWKFSTTFRVLVKNDDGQLTGDASKWCLRVRNETTSEDVNTIYSFNLSRAMLLDNLNDQYLKFSHILDNAKGLTAGIQEDDGIAFYYSYLDAENATIKFTLFNTETKEEKSYTVSGKTMNTGGKSGGSKCYGVALKHSNFK